MVNAMFTSHISKTRVCYWLNSWPYCERVTCPFRPTDVASEKTKQAAEGGVTESRPEEEEGQDKHKTK